MTIIVVPYEVLRFDKITRDVDEYFELSWALGGLGQAGIGAWRRRGAGCARRNRNHFGGDLPDASHLTGMAVGATGSLACVEVWD